MLCLVVELRFYYDNELKLTPRRLLFLPSFAGFRFLKRRAKEEFRKHAQETDQAAVNKALKQAKENIAMIERTSLVYGVYAPKHSSVLVSAQSLSLSLSRGCGRKKSAEKLTEFHISQGK